MTDIPIYGIDKELAQKAMEKYDPVREQQAREWLGVVTSSDVNPSIPFDQLLKSGVLLCRAFNAVAPSNLMFKFSESNMPFKQMENIASFLSAAEKLGCPKHDLFQTVDLYEAKNMGAVVDAIFSLSRHATKNGFNGPVLGPKLAEKREVSFSDEQLKTYVPSQQMGFTGGANQSGMTYGLGRQIVDPKAADIHKPISQEPTQQMGFTGGANQSGMSYGLTRQIVDPKAADIHKPISQEPTQQMGFTGGANQSGMSYGLTRQIVDPKSSDIHQPISQEPTILNSAGAQGANQSSMGVTFNNKRQII